MGDAIHAERREPQEPAGAFDLGDAGDELLETAGELDAGRASRTLTPGAGAMLKQTLLALREGRRLDPHTTNGTATIQVLRGAVVISADGDELALDAGQWAVIPQSEHDLRAESDAVVLLTVASAA
jgi:quercetin dioxygenase-like cupin family protein